MIEDLFPTPIGDPDQDHDLEGQETGDFGLAGDPCPALLRIGTMPRRARSLRARNLQSIIIPAVITLILDFTLAGTALGMARAVLTNINHTG